MSCCRVLLHGVFAFALVVLAPFPGRASSSGYGGSNSSSAYAANRFTAYVPPPSLSATLFGTSEIRSTGLGSFPNWTGMWARFQQEQRLGQGLCASAGSDGGRCAWDEWQDLLARAKPLPPSEQMETVNREMNRQRYKVDRSNWGLDDYWETVFEFMRRKGDCEDYAIAKYVTLRALGWPVDSLRVVIVRDTKLDVNHAVLAIYTDQGIYIGDNQVSGLVRAEKIRHYKPIYSINEQGWWLHRPMARP